MMNEMRKLMEAVNRIDEANSFENYIYNMKQKYESALYYANTLEAELRKKGNTASAATISNIIGSTQQSIKLFDTALADLGNQYTRPGEVEEAINYIDEMEIDEAAGGVQVSMIIVDDDEVYVSEEVRSITPDQAGDFIELCINAVFGGGRYEGVDSDSIIEALQELGLTKEPEGEDEEDY